MCKQKKKITKTRKYYWALITGMKQSVFFHIPASSGADGGTENRAWKQRAPSRQRDRAVHSGPGQTARGGRRVTQRNVVKTKVEEGRGRCICGVVPWQRVWKARHVSALISIQDRSGVFFPTSPRFTSLSLASFLTPREKGARKQSFFFTSSLLQNCSRF